MPGFVVNNRISQATDAARDYIKCVSFKKSQLDSLSVSEISDFLSNSHASILKANINNYELLMPNPGLGLHLYQYYPDLKTLHKLVQAMQLNNTVRVLDLSGSKIDDTCINQIIKIIQTNSALFKIDIRGNSIGDNGIAMIADALKYNYSLQSLEGLAHPAIDNYIDRNRSQAEGSNNYCNFYNDNICNDSQAEELSDKTPMLGADDQTACCNIL
ncbi:MAG: hypothetical protein K0Q51_1029 [Rickettsiaceae bacterium]|jgi:hypothetical protein|nr:hypothetical protein [Rickettsiaceae bacterium]